MSSHEELRASLCAALASYLARCARRREYLAVVAQGIHPLSLADHGIQLEEKQLTLAVLDFQHSSFRGPRENAIRSFRLIVGHQLERRRGECEYEFHLLPNNKLGFIFFGLARDRLRAISGAAQKFNEMFNPDGEEGDEVVEKDGVPATVDPIVIYALASPLEAAFALRTFNDMRSGALRTDPVTFLPDLAEMLLTFAERRLWLDTVRDLLPRVVLETWDYHWTEWCEVQDFPAVKQLPTDVKDALAPSTLTDMRQLPKEEWAEYIGCDLMPEIRASALDALFSDAQSAQRRKDLSKERACNLEICAIDYLLEEDRILYARAEQEKREKEKEDADTEDYCDEE